MRIIMESGENGYFDYTPAEMYGKIVTPKRIMNKQPYYGVYVSRFLMDVDTFRGPFEEKVSLKSKKCKNKNNKMTFDKNLVYSNYLLLPVFNISNTKAGDFVMGEEVIVGIIEQDLKSLFIKPYNNYSQEHNRPDNKYTIYVPASGKHGDSGLNDDNTYYVGLDSDNQTLRIHTSKDNGETSAWDMLFDGGMGTFRLTDGGRSILIDSSSDLIALKTAENKSTVAMRKGTVNVLCDDFILDAKKSITMKSPKTTAELDSVKWTTNDLEAEIKMATISGTKIETEYTTGVTTFKSNWDISSKLTAWEDGPVGFAMLVGLAGGASFGAIPGGVASPTSPSASDTGSNFAGPAGQPMAHAQPVMMCLTQIGVTVDALASMFGVPPVSATIAANAPKIPSTFLKG